MKTVQLPLPLLGAVAATRGMLGVGAGLLIAKSLPERTRRVLGWALLATGVVSTVPLAVGVMSRRNHGD
jgi:hypothetical protein